MPISAPQASPCSAFSKKLPSSLAISYAPSRRNRGLSAENLVGPARRLDRLLPMNEADTCRKFIVPLLQAAGWDNEPHSIPQQRWFTKGPIAVRGNRAERRKGKRAAA